MEENLLNTVKDYVSVIAKFKNKSGVLNGSDIAWKGSADVATLANTPYSIGDGLGTTGWCVSASEALLNDNIFQLTLIFRSAKAKLISIDIKEQYYGYCYNGSQNKWHTAILVDDNGYKFIIDITCRQFGDNFIEKDIWDLNTWIDTLRHPFCKHHLTDNLDCPILITPIVSRNKNINRDLLGIDTIDKFRSFTNLDENDRSILTDFYLNKMFELNEKLILGTLSRQDFSYINSLTKLLTVCPFIGIDYGFSVLQFDTKAAAKRWLELFLDSGNTLPIYMNVSKTLNDSCKQNNIDFLDLNKEYYMGNENDKTYIVFQFNKVFGVKNVLEYSELLLASGNILSIKNPVESVFNSGKQFDPVKNMNTIIIKID